MTVREKSWHTKCGWSVKRGIQFAAIFLIGLVVGSPSVTHAQSQLDSILQKLDQTSANFRSAEASFVWDQYQKVVDETDTQKGKICFRRVGGKLEMAAEITDPSPEQVLFNDDKVQMYQPKIDQVTVYNTGKDKSAVESFLVLGFGGSGKDMQKSFDVKYIGQEKVLGTDTAKLELTPKAQKVKSNVEKILLWIDPNTGVSVQQQFLMPGGDYKLAKYADIKVNEKIPDTAFKLKTTSKTKVVSPQG